MFVLPSLASIAVAAVHIINIQHTYVLTSSLGSVVLRGIQMLRLRLKFYSLEIIKLNQGIS